MIQLLNNEGISFIAAKNFTYGGTEYVMGQEFPQEEARNIETLVRARFVLPVLEEGALRPRHWHGHIRTREEAEEYLNRDRVQLVWPTEPDTAVDLETLTYPERTPEPEGEGEDVFAPTADTESSESPSEPEADPEPPESLEETYDPAEHNVEAVLQYMDEHPEQREEVLAMERAGRGRKGILGDDE
jgi:hypothetical protein